MRYLHLLFIFLLTVVEVHSSDLDLSEKTNLKVALFPYIPDAGEDSYQGFEKKIKKEFEYQNPDITLSLRHINQEDNFYDNDFLISLLKDNHIVEIDNLFLGQLKKQGVIGEWNLEKVTQKVDFFQKGWLPAAHASLLTEGSVYGLPHWLCGYYIFSRDPQIANAHTFQELTEALYKSSENGKFISTDFKGKWDKVGLYLDAYSTQNPINSIGIKREDWTIPLSTPLDESTMNAFVKVAKHRIEDESDPDQAAISFATGNAKSMIGYSERMHLIEKKNAYKEKPVYFGNLPFSTELSKVSPALYVDSFVKSSFLTVKKEEEDAAVKFVQYMSNPQTVEWMVMSLDVPELTRVPRYLLPSLQSSYSEGIISDHIFYQQIYKISENSIPLPQFGVPKVVKFYAEEIEKFIK